MGKFCWNPRDFKRTPLVDFSIQWGSFVFYLEMEFDGKLAGTLIAELSGMCAKSALPSCWALWKTHHLGVCPGKVNHWVSSAGQPFKAMPVDWTDRVSSFSLSLSLKLAALQCCLFPSFRNSTQEVSVYWLLLETLEWRSRPKGWHLMLSFCILAPTPPWIRNLGILLTQIEPQSIHPLNTQVTGRVPKVRGS